MKMHALKSLQKRILFTFSVLALTFVCVGMLLSVLSAQTYKKDIASRNMNLVTSIASHLNETLGHHSSELSMLASVISGISPADYKCQELMTDLQDRHQLFKKILLLDADGLIVRLVPEQPEMVGRDLADQPFLNRAYASSDEVTFSGRYKCPLCGYLTVAMSISSGEDRLVAFLDLDYFSRVVKEDYPLVEGYLAVTDSSGDVIAHTMQRLGVGDLQLAVLFPVMREYKNLSGSFEEKVNGDQGLVSIQKLSDNGWSVIIFQHFKGAFGVVERIRNEAAAVLGVTLSATLFLMLMIMDRIMGPIRRMVRQTRKVAEGYYGVTIEPKYVEFQELAESFDTMTQSIKAREDALIKSKQHYKYLYNQNPIPIIIFDLTDLRVLDINDAAIEKYGYSREEFIGLSVTRIRPEEDVPAALRKFHNVPPGRDDIGVRRHMKKDGTIIYVEIISHGIDYLGKNVRMAICKDVTLQFKAETALQESEERFRATLESIGHSIIIVDHDLKIIWANNAAAATFGYVEDAKCHVTLSGSLVPCAGCNALRVFAEETAFKRIEHMTTKEGLEGTYIVTTNPMYDSYGNVVGVVKSMKDITDLRQSEQKLRDSLAEKEALLKTVHHQVKNNLQAISGIINLQQAYSPDFWTRKVLQDSQDRIFSLSLIYEKLHKEDGLNRIDFSDYVDTLVRRLSSTYMAKERNIQVDVACGDIYLNVDTAVPCGLILTELISNAFKHAFIQKITGNIDIRVNKEDPDLIWISVDDDGVGLPGDLEETHLDSLGLNIVRSNVEFLSGRVKATVEQGTHFDIIVHEYEECSHMDL